MSYDQYAPNESNTIKNTNVEEGKIAYLYLYNSTFDGNFYYKDITAANDNGTYAGQGAAIQVHGNGKFVGLNCSFNNHQGNYAGVIRTRAGTASTVYIVSCTGNTPRTFHNQKSNAYVYNSILNGLNSTNGLSTALYNTIQSDKLYNDKAEVSSTITFEFSDQIGAYANGVFPVASGSAAATNGMTSDALSALATTITAEMPLFETKYLTVDQKGNSREDKTVMGAYVGK